jgi:hypothetical protein
MFQTILLCFASMKDIDKGLLKMLEGINIYWNIFKMLHWYIKIIFVQIQHTFSTLTYFLTLLNMSKNIGYA